MLFGTTGLNFTNSKKKKKKKKFYILKNILDILKYLLKIEMYFLY